MIKLFTQILCDLDGNSYKQIYFRVLCSFTDLRIQQPFLDARYLASLILHLLQTTVTRDRMHNLPKIHEP